MEKELHSRIKKWCKPRGIKMLKLSMMKNYGEAGWPDVLLLVPGGTALFMELKRPGEKARALQEHRLNTIRELGFKAEVVDDYDEAIGIIESARGLDTT